MYVNQSIHRPQGVNVFGSCLVRAEPDYASLRFQVITLAPQPKLAIEQAHASAHKVRKVLARAKIAERDLQQSRLSLELAFEGYGAERREAGYQAQIAFQLLVRELARVEQLLVELVDAGARAIDAVSYKTSRIKELRRQARAGAVEAARAKAEVYAGAAGQQLGLVQHIEDINPDDVGRRSHAPDIDLAEHSEHSEAEAGPGSITVAGAVMVSFGLLGPG